MNASEWAVAVLEHSWRASWLIVMLVVLRFVASRWIPARFFFAGWLIVAVHLLLPVGVMTHWSPYNLAARALSSIAATTPISAQGAVVRTESPSSPDGLESGVGAGGDALVADVGGTRFDFENVFVVVWSAGVLALLAARVARDVVFRRRLREARCEGDERITTELGNCSRLLALRRAPEVVISRAVDAPAIVGVFRPRLLFPPQFSDAFSTHELRLMILHELGHWQRGDIAANALLQAVRIVHWFNPLVWVATRLARQDCELACDEFVMRRASSAETHTYGATLLKVLGVVRGQNRSPQVLGILENKQQLKRRIQMIVNYRTSTTSRVMAGALLLAAVAFVAVTREARAEAGKVDTGAGGVDRKGVGEITAEAPVPWFKNGSVPAAYDVGVDPTQPHVKPVSAYIKSVQPEVEGFGGMMQSFSAEDYRGKRVRLSAWVKSQDVKGTANVWMRIDGKGKAEDRMLQFDNMNGREVVGTTEWKKHAVVLDVPQEAEAIAMGFFVSGTGQAWFNDSQFDVVGDDVPSTSLKTVLPGQTKARVKAPRNLDFAEKTAD